MMVMLCIGCRRTAEHLMLLALLPQLGDDVFGVYCIACNPRGNDKPKVLAKSGWRLEKYGWEGLGGMTVCS